MGVCAAANINKQEGQQSDETYFEEVASQEVGGSASSFQEGFSGDGHAHRGKLGEVVDEAVHALEQAAGQADEQAAPLLLGLLPRTAPPSSHCQASVHQQILFKQLCVCTLRAVCRCLSRQHCECTPTCNAMQLITK